MDIPLVVIPDPRAWSWIDPLDRKQILHLPGFEYASLRINEWDALPVEDESWIQFVRRQVVVYLAESSDMIECCHPQQGVIVRFIHVGQPLHGK